MEHTAVVSAIAFDRASRRLITGTADRGVHLWDLNTQQEIAGPLLSHCR